ncbi:cache domain-containing sensor histidine kinase [Paenibacillus radicis (ex Gao et al. 2016)]|uniref:histidine kinase n=1 Tax=Paenibacillus radicis (ex Gao et al. 2016) TaxID=1737354 RepID=A0A917HLJ4_9BACL|nr:sensor histidine kinase [Paenibacillus radicis (ex Gao et al. 2016)]GGG83618.1 histidine kinase [Paenibacillus radicis (ex Gao et al. 2016)]
MAGAPLHKQERSFIPFGVKLLVSYILLIVIPIFIFGYIANSIMVDSIRTQTKTAIKGTLQQIQDNMMYKIDDTTRLSDLLYFDSKLSKQLMHYEEGWVSYEATTNLLMPKFWQTIESTNRNVWLTIYFSNETLPEIYYDTSNIDPLRIKGRFFDVMHLKRIEHKEWYADFPKEKFGETMEWKQVEDDAKYGRISLLRRIVDTTDPTKLKEIGFVRISTYLNDIFQSVDYHKIGGDSTLVITNENGHLLYSSGSAVQSEDEFRNEASSGSHLTIDQTLPGLGWKLTALIPSSVFEEDRKKVDRLTIIICLLCGIVISFVAAFVSRTFSRRVLKVVSVLQSFRQGDFHRRIQYSGNDEFTTIAASLNELGKKTQSLIEEVYVTNLKKKEAELEVLQAQINPHFLYNTLSSISRLAKFGEVDKQHQMVMNLAKFYRLTLNEGQTIIPIAKEIEQVKAYMDIQQIKYAERVEVVYEIDPSILPYSAVKLILQPFIENALEHAWRGDRIQIRIVGGWQDDAMIFFHIIDNGSGMPQSTIDGIFNETAAAERSGYGIRNVHERIQLYYGKEYGVAIESEPGEGTCVQVMIPAQIHPIANSES